MNAHRILSCLVAVLICGACITGLLAAEPIAPIASPSVGAVRVEIVEGVPDKRSWDVERPQPVESFTEQAVGLVAVPKKFDAKGLVHDRATPYLLIARVSLKMPRGEYRLLLRSHDAARLIVDGELLVETAFLTSNKASHERLPVVERIIEPSVYPLPIGHQEKLVALSLDGGEHEFVLETIVGGKGLRAELGELVVALARPGEPLRLLSAEVDVKLDDQDWPRYAQETAARRRQIDDVTRQEAQREEFAYWNMRHDLARRLLTEQPGPQPPELVDASGVDNAVDAFIAAKLSKRGVEPAPLTDDHAFLRRVFLDTVGVLPTVKEIEVFLAEKSAERRTRVIDRLLADPRWADNWVGYWQDVLAENPALLKPQLNNTGPFRWWIHQSLLDNKSMDRFATELILMEGSKFGGGPAGFSMATMNDVPMAAKAHVLGKAFLGIDMQCARCHDAPYHPFKQQQLFSLGAMLNKKPLIVPKSSTVDIAGRTRVPQVEITLKAGTAVEPAWSFGDLAPAEPPSEAMRNPEDSRERLAAILTSPHNRRFVQVLANRLWKRYLGWGLVEPVDDWSDNEASHPRLLEFLGHELATHDYDLKHIADLILNSHTYQRQVRPDGLRFADSADRLFASPARRRMSAEQMVDSLFHLAGKDFHTEALCLDPEGRRPISQFLNLGKPTRAWEFTSLSNDRDRPSLSLPFSQHIVDVLVVLGWRESRQNPITVRDETATVLQPMLLANGVVGRRITTLSDDSLLTELCLEERPLPDLVHEMFLRILSRPPHDAERELFGQLLTEGYSERLVPGAKKELPPPVPTTAVSWANHFDPESVRIKIRLAEEARKGDPPSKRLEADWRERMEDMIWSLVHSPEFIFIP